MISWQNKIKRERSGEMPLSMEGGVPLGVWEFDIGIFPLQRNQNVPNLNLLSDNMPVLHVHMFSFFMLMNPSLLQINMFTIMCMYTDLTIFKDWIKLNVCGRNSNFRFLNMRMSF